MKLELSVGPLHSAVRQAAIATSEESRGIDFTFENGLLVLSGRAADVGQSRVELPVAYSGPKVSIALDPRFFSDFLRVLGSRKNLHPGTERFRQRRRLQHRRRLRLRHHAAGPRSLKTPEPRNPNPYLAYPKPIADVLSQLIAKRGYARQRSTATLESAWRQAVGEKFAATTRAGNLRRGTLEITVANNLLAQELGFRKDELIEPTPTPRPRRNHHQPPLPHRPHRQLIASRKPDT